MRTEAIYARQSIDKKDSVSIETQIEKCELIIDSEKEIYKDKGYSSKNIDRPEDNLTAGISLLTVIPVNTEILGIIKGSFVIPVGQAMSPNFLRYSGGILTQETCNVFKRCSFVQFVFNVDTVFKGKMFLIAWYIFTHCFPPSTAVRRRDENIMNI